MPNHECWTLKWSHGECTVQSLGGMLASLRFVLPDGHSLMPLHIAPWRAEDNATFPVMLQALKGEWPCVPFGRTDTPKHLPKSFGQHPADDEWAHGFSSHHVWHLKEKTDHSLSIVMEYPTSSPIRSLERTLFVTPGAAKLSFRLSVLTREDIKIPIALHPTFSIFPSGMHIVLPKNQGIFTYPVATEEGVSQLMPNRVAEALSNMPTQAGGTLDLSRYPLAMATEELMQIKDCEGAIALCYPALNAKVTLAWDRTLLPDAMIWVSHGGRQSAPWFGRHFALGIEPLCGFFDLGRVAIPPPSHALSGREGVPLVRDRQTHIEYALSADTLARKK